MATRLIAVMLSVMLSGCYELPEECQQDAQCEADQVCLKRTCVVPTEPLLDAGASPRDVGADASTEDAAPSVDDAGAADATVQDAAHAADATPPADAGPPQELCGNGVLDEGEECEDLLDVRRGCHDCLRQPDGTGSFITEGYGCAILHADVADRGSRHVVCWGSNSKQQLGADTRIGWRLVPSPLAESDTSGVVQIAGNPSGACGLLRGTRRDEIKCWGDLKYTTRGGATSQSMVWEAVADLPLDGRVHHVAMGLDTTCVIAGPSRKVWCWGKDALGETGRGVLGTPTSEYFVVPDTVREASGDHPELANISSIAMGASFTIALRTTGGGELGLVGWGAIPGQSQGLYAVDLESLLTQGDQMFAGRPLQVTAGEGHYCVLTDDLTQPLWCYGQNDYGQIGSATLAQTHSIVSLGANDLIDSVHAYKRGTCAVGGEEDGARNKVWCWGDDSHAQLGGRMPVDRRHRMQPIRNAVPEGDNIELVLGGLAQFRCSLNAGAQVRCWGRNDKNQAGIRYGHGDVSAPVGRHLDSSEWATGLDEASAVHHCLVTRDLNQASGIKWILADQAPYQAYCDNALDRDGGGWALAMELNVDPWNAETPGLRYGDDFWSTTNVGNTFSPQNTITITQKSLAVFRQEVRDLAIDLIPQQVVWGNHTANQLMNTNAPETWLTQRSIVLRRAVESSGTLHRLLTADQGSALTIDASRRAQWMALVPDTAGVHGTKTFSAILGINPDAVSGESNCWFAGFNRSHGTSRLRLGVLVANSTCATSYHNFIGFGFAGNEDYYPTVGAIGTSESGYNRAALWSDARIWVR